jgi:hypothetical protein
MPCLAHQSDATLVLCRFATGNSGYLNSFLRCSTAASAEPFDHLSVLLFKYEFYGISQFERRELIAVVVYNTSLQSSLLSPKSPRDFEWRSIPQRLHLDFELIQ